MPCLLLRGSALVKTARFESPVYVGDPVNAVNIFNEKEVDELILLDIGASPSGHEPQFELIEQIASECFMPLTYGGGVRTLEQMERLYRSGVEKIALNTAAVEEPTLVAAASARFGAQAVVVSIDAKRRRLGGHRVRYRCGQRELRTEPAAHAAEAQRLGAGEILLTSIDQDGTMQGYDIDLVRSVASAVDVPVIASGGAGTVEDFVAAVEIGEASAVAAGSMVVFHGRQRAVLINFPDRAELERLLP